MAKDIRLYLEYLQQVEVTSFTGPACLGAFNLATSLGYGDQISNRVVDAIGDVAGGVRIQAKRRRIMRIATGRVPGAASEQRGPTFTGRVWADPVLGAEDGVMVNNVFFEPKARTHWHTHEVTQVLYVLAGEGWVQVRGGVGGPISAGDTVHIPAGEEHWHGARTTASCCTSRSPSARRSGSTRSPTTTTSARSPRSRRRMSSPLDTARLAWVDHECRLLRGIREQFAQTRPFAGLTIGSAIHLEPKTAALVRTLQIGGAEIIATGNLNSTQPATLAYFQDTASAWWAA